MPLEKAPVGSAGFGRNVATEMKAGKPVKQAVAIAYEKAGERKDSINNAPIYEENGEFFFPKPGSKERFGPYASKAEATSAAAKAGVVADADEAILGRADADRLPAHIKHHGIHIDTSFKKGSNGTEADYWVVQGSGGRFYSLEAAKEVAEGIAKRKAHKDDAKADSLPPLARALAAADSMYTKALDSVHRKDAERDLPGAGTTEGNYGIDAERDLTGEGTADAGKASAAEIAHAKERIEKAEGVFKRAKSDESRRKAKSELESAKYAYNRKMGYV